MPDAIFQLKENPFVSQALIMAYIQTECATSYCIRCIFVLA